MCVQQDMLILLLPITLQHRSESLALGSTSGTLDHLPNNPNLLCILDNISIILVCCEGNNHILGMITGREQLGAENSCTQGAVHPICRDNLKLLSEPNQNITHLLKTTRGALVHFMWQMNTVWAPPTFPEPLFSMIFRNSPASLASSETSTSLGIIMSLHCVNNPIRWEFIWNTIEKLYLVFLWKRWQNGLGNVLLNLKMPWEVEADH